MQLVVEALDGERHDSEEERAAELWPKKDVWHSTWGRSKEVDLVVATVRGSQWWFEAKKGVPPQEEEAKEDLEWMLRDCAARSKGEKAQAGDLYEMVFVPRTKGATDWRCLDSLLVKARPDPRQWLEGLIRFSAEQERANQLLWEVIGGARVDEAAVLSFLPRLRIREIKAPEELVRSLYPDVVADRQQAHQLLELVGERWSVATAEGQVLTISDLRVKLADRRIFVSPSIQFERTLEELRREEQGSRHVGSLHRDHPEWRVSRPALLEELERLLDRGHVLLHGDPGVGKSTLLQDLDRKNAGVLVLPAAAFQATSRRDLEERRLGRMRTKDFLSRWALQGGRVLAIDGLDEIQETTLQRIGELLDCVREIRSLHVVVSSRGPTWKRLRRELALHLETQVIPPFTPAELEEALHMVGCQAILDLDPRWRRLLSNPFVLRLLVELVVEAGQQAFTGVATMGRLLKEYWHRSVESAGLAEAACRLAEFAMDSDLVGRRTIEEGKARDLVEKGIARWDGDGLWFAHRILRDYALVRAKEGAEPGTGLVRWLEQNPGHMASPGIVRLWMLHLRARDPGTSGGRGPWDRLEDLLASRVLHRALAHEALQALGETFVPADVPGLARVVSTDLARVPLLGRLLRVRSDLVKREQRAEEADWALAQLLATPSFADAADHQAGGFLAQLERVATGDHRTELARIFFVLWVSLARTAQSPSGPAWPALEVMARFVPTGVKLGHEMGDGFSTWYLGLAAVHGHLAQEVAETLVEAERVHPGAGVRAWEVLLTRKEEETADAHESLILTTAADATTNLLDLNPPAMTAAVCRILERRARLRRAIRGGEPAPASTPVSGVEPAGIRCTEDGSHHWAVRSYMWHEAERRALAALAAIWIRWARGEGSRPLAESLASLELTARTALPWSRFLRVTAELADLSSAEGGSVPTGMKSAEPVRPEAVDQFAELALRFLQESDNVGCASMSWEAGGALVALGSLAKHVGRCLRASENLLRSVEGSTGSNTRTWILRALARLEGSSSSGLRGIGLQALHLLQGGRPTAPADPSDVWTGSPSPKELDAAMDIDIEHPRYDALAEPRHELAAVRSRADGEGDLEDRVRLAQELEKRIQELRSNIDERHRREAYRLIVNEAADVAGEFRKVSQHHLSWARGVLVDAASNEDPIPDGGDPALPFLSPSARSQAARGLAMLAHRSSLDQRERSFLECLASDPAGSVRFTLACYVGFLREKEWDLAWRIAQTQVRNASGPVDAEILVLLLDRLERNGFQWKPDGAERLMALLRAVWERRNSLPKVTDGSPGESALAQIARLAIVLDHEDARAFLEERFVEGDVSDLSTVSEAAADLLAELCKPGRSQEQPSDPLEAERRDASAVRTARTLTTCLSKFAESLAETVPIRQEEAADRFLQPILRPFSRLLSESGEVSKAGMLHVPRQVWETLAAWDSSLPPFGFWVARSILILARAFIEDDPSLAARLVLAALHREGRPLKRDVLRLGQHALDTLREVLRPERLESRTTMERKEIENAASAVIHDLLAVGFDPARRFYAEWQGEGLE